MVTRIAMALKMEVGSSIPIMCEALIGRVPQLVGCSYVPCAKRVFANTKLAFVGQAIPCASLTVHGLALNRERLSMVQRYTSSTEIDATQSCRGNSRAHPKAHAVESNYGTRCCLWAAQITRLTFWQIMHGRETWPVPLMEREPR